MECEKVLLVLHYKAAAHSVKFSRIADALGANWAAVVLAGLRQRSLLGRLSFPLFVVTLPIALPSGQHGPC